MSLKFGTQDILHFHNNQGATFSAQLRRNSVLSKLKNKCHESHESKGERNEDITVVEVTSAGYSLAEDAG